MKKSSRTEASKTRGRGTNGRPDPSWTVARLSRYFGVAPERLILHPRPGMATEDDLLYVNAHDRFCELVDGVLVEKAMGFYEGLLAVVLIRYLSEFVIRHKLGIVVNGDSNLRLFPGLVRLPDVSFISWDRLPGRKVPTVAVADLAPDLAVEVVSRGNSKKEMERKLDEYFRYGVRLVWMVYPKKKTVDVYTSRADKRTLRENDTLDGGDVLPGFALALAELFTPPEAPPEA
jgi:Uma2 family endonuclease